MALGYANWATTLAAALTAHARTATLTSTTAAPAAPFLVKVDSEYILVTRAVGRVVSLTRGMEGSTPAAHRNGAVVRHVVTGDTLLMLQTLASRNTPESYARPASVRAAQAASAR